MSRKEETTEVIKKDKKVFELLSKYHLSKLPAGPTSTNEISAKGATNSPRASPLGTLETRPRGVGGVGAVRLTGHRRLL